MHPGRLMIEINVVQNDIFDNFDFDHKAVQSNLTELLFLNLMNKLKTFFSGFPTIVELQYLNTCYYISLQTYW